MVTSYHLSVFVFISLDVLRFSEFDPLKFPKLQISHDICFILGTIYEHDTDSSLVDEVVDIFQQHRSDLQRHEILDFFTATKIRLHEAAKRKYAPLIHTNLLIKIIVRNNIHHLGDTQV